MIKLKELERKLKKRQKRYNELLKLTAQDGPRQGRMGDEIVDIQLRVLETAIAETKKGDNRA